MVNTRTVKPGTSEFNHVVFVVPKISYDMLRSLNFSGRMFQNVNDVVYSMPVYISKQINFAFVLSRFIDNQWVITLAQIRIEDRNNITGMSQLMYTGQGINTVAKYSQHGANNILRYFNTLETVNRGSWHFITK